MMQKEALQTVAAFDFDGTISYRDSLVPFLFFRFGWFKTLLGLGLLAPLLALDVALGRDRQTMKERVLTYFFKGMPLNEVTEDAHRFAKESLPSQIRPEALQRIKWHNDQGHRCILVSASMNLYLIPWAHSVGINEVLSSELAVNSENRLTGYLKGKNCRGAEKTRRLDELLGPKDQYILYAYGDSKGDKEMLALADFPFMKEMPDA